jgi:5'-methylthioadenosine phosphorylase
MKVLATNADKARSLVKHVFPKIINDVKGSVCSCRTALEYSIVTSLEARDTNMIGQLDAIAGRVLKR